MRRCERYSTVRIAENLEKMIDWCAVFGDSPLLQDREIDDWGKPKIPDDLLERLAMMGEYVNREDVDIEVVVKYRNPTRVVKVRKNVKKSLSWQTKLACRDEEITRLRDEECLSWKQVGEKMGVTDDTACAAYHRKKRRA